VLERDGSQEVNRFSAVSDLVSAGSRDDSREANRLPTVFDLVRDGDGGPWEINRFSAKFDLGSY
jgi:hypothetical protein